MSASLLQQAMSPEVLDRAWRRLRNEHTPWAVGVDRDELQRHLFRHTLRMREQILSGAYRPQPLRHFAMAKPDGGQRVLSAQYLQDKLAQRALLIVLEPRAEAVFHEDSYAYRPNRNVQLALARVRERVRIGLDWLVDADIHKYFDTIPHKPLLRVLKPFVRDTPAMKLIESWIRHGTHHGSFLGTRRGIAQGAILSPMFCNLYLNQFDAMLTRANIPFVRFADDFLLFAQERRQAEAARAFARKALDQLGLTLHPDKTRIVRSGPKVTFLGERLPKPVR
ncbi:MAG TPA: Retron-type reverse transcriptase [Gammaproteobacteria bacterium]|nr:Retron-type reverse transcriptase [Gammaproteobacteria bacterium]